MVDISKFKPLGWFGVDAPGIMMFDYDENNNLVGSHIVDAVVYSHNGLTTTLSGDNND